MKRFIALLLLWIPVFIMAQVISNENPYGWGDGRYAFIGTSETVSRTIYVSTTGSDVTGNGSVTYPYATMLKAYSTIKNYIPVGVTITIQLGSGSFTYNSAEVEKYTRNIYCAGSGKVVVQGTITQDYTGLTLTARTGANTPYIYDVTGATFTASALTGYYVYDGTNYYPIVDNSSSTITANVGIAGTIVAHNVSTINLSSNSFCFSYPGSNRGTNAFQNVNINYTSSNITTSVTTSTKLLFESCNITFKQWNVGVHTGRMLLNRNYINLSATMDAGILFNGFQSFQMLGNVLLGKAGMVGIAHATDRQVQVLPAWFSSNYFKTWGYAMALSGPNSVCLDYNATLYNAASIVLDGVTAFCLARDGSSLVFEAGSKLYCATTLTNLITYTGYYGGQVTKDFKFICPIIYGTVTNFTSWSTNRKFTDVGNSFVIRAQGLYAESDAQVNTTLADNSSGTIAVGNTTQNEVIKFVYEATRGTSQEFGTIYLTKKSDAVLSETALFDDCGLTFSKSVSSNVIYLGWTTTSTGTAVTFKYTIERIMI